MPPPPHPRAIEPQRPACLGRGALAGLLVVIALWLPHCGPLVLVAWVPLLRGLVRGARPREAFLAGYLSGLVLYGLGGAWIPLARLPGALLPLGFLLAVALLSLGPGLWAVALAALARRRTGLALAAAPGLWVLVETLRASGELGYPWLHLGHALAEHPRLAQLAALGGVPLLSLWVVALNATLAGSRGRPLRRVALAGALAALPALGGLAATAWDAGSPHETRALRLAAVQPAIPAERRHRPEFLDANLRELIELSDRVGEERPDLIVWPESALELPLGSAGELLLSTLSNHLGAPLLTGIRRRGHTRQGTSFNSAALSWPGGRVERVSDKVQPVPVYERRPTGPLARALAAAGAWPGSVTPGTSPGLIELPFVGSESIRAGVLICFDSSFPALARDLQRRGAQLLVEMSNLVETGTWAARQHALSARLRAVETGLPLVRVGNGGSSEWIDGRGRLVARLPAGVPSAGSALVRPVSGGTPYARFGDTPVLWLALLPPVLGLLPGRPRNRSPH